MRITLPATFSVRSTTTELVEIDLSDFTMREISHLSSGSDPELLRDLEDLAFDSLIETRPDAEDLSLDTSSLADLVREALLAGAEPTPVVLTICDDAASGPEDETVLWSPRRAASTLVEVADAR